MLVRVTPLSSIAVGYASPGHPGFYGRPPVRALTAGFATATTATARPSAVVPGASRSIADTGLRRDAREASNRAARAEAQLAKQADATRKWKALADSRGQLIKQLRELPNVVAFIRRLKG